MFLACYNIGDFYTRQYGLVQSKTRGALLILLECLINNLMSYEQVKVKGRIECMCKVIVNI